MVIFISISASAAGSNASQGSQSTSDEASAVKAWKIGDECLAMWSEDSQWLVLKIYAIYGIYSYLIIFCLVFFFFFFFFNVKF